MEPNPSPWAYFGHATNAGPHKGARNRRPMQPQQQTGQNFPRSSSRNESHSHNHHSGAAAVRDGQTGSDGGGDGRYMFALRKSTLLNLNFNHDVMKCQHTLAETASEQVQHRRDTGAVSPSRNHGMNPPHVPSAASAAHTLKSRDAHACGKDVDSVEMRRTQDCAPPSQGHGRAASACASGENINHEGQYAQEDDTIKAPQHCHDHQTSCSYTHSHEDVDANLETHHDSHTLSRGHHRQGTHTADVEPHTARALDRVHVHGKAIGAAHDGPKLVFADAHSVASRSCSSLSCHDVELPAHPNVRAHNGSPSQNISQLKDSATCRGGSHIAAYSSNRTQYAAGGRHALGNDDDDCCGGGCGCDAARDPCALEACHDQSPQSMQAKSHKLFMSMDPVAPIFMLPSSPTGSPMSLHTCTSPSSQAALRCQRSLRNLCGPGQKLLRAAAESPESAGGNISDSFSRPEARMPGGALPRKSSKIPGLKAPHKTLLYQQVLGVANFEINQYARDKPHKDAAAAVQELGPARNMWHVQPLSVHNAEARLKNLDFVHRNPTTDSQSGSAGAPYVTGVVHHGSMAMTGLESSTRRLSVCDRLLANQPSMSGMVSLSAQHRQAGSRWAHDMRGKDCHAGAEVQAFTDAKVLDNHAGMPASSHRVSGRSLSAPSLSGRRDGFLPNITGDRGVKEAPVLCAGEAARFGRAKSDAKARESELLERSRAHSIQQDVGVPCSSECTEGREAAATGGLKPGKKDAKATALVWCGAARTKVPVYMQTLQLDINSGESAAAAWENPVAGKKAKTEDVAGKRSDGKARAGKPKGRA